MGAGIDLSLSTSTAGGTSGSQTTLLSGLSGGTSSTTLQVTSSVLNSFPTAISLSQTDLDTLTPNDPATLLLSPFIPFQSSTSNVFFDFDFDVSSNIPALTATDAFTLESCVYSGDSIAQFVLLSDFAPACAAEGGTAVTRASLGSGTALPVVDPVAAYGELVAPNVQSVAAFRLSFQIKNDTGPTTLSLDNFTMTMSEVPEPGAALLLSTALLGLLGAQRRR